MPMPLIKKLDEVTFVVGFIPAMESPKVWVQLSKVAGPLVAQVFEMVDQETAPSPDGGDGETSTPARFGDLDLKAALADGKLDRLLKLLGDVDPDALTDLMRTFAKVTRVQGTKVSLLEQFDLVFTGRPKLMTRWFIEAITTNFRDFWSSTGGAPG